MQYAGISEASDQYYHRELSGDRTVSVKSGPTTSLTRAVAESSYLSRQKKVMVGGSNGNPRTNPIQKHVSIGSADSNNYRINVACTTLSADDVSTEESAMDLEKPIRGKFVIYSGEAIPNQEESERKNNCSQEMVSFPMNSAKVEATQKRLPTHIVIGHNNDNDEMMHEEDGSTQLNPLDDYFSVAFMDVDPSPQPPLIVVDGANIAHSYSECKQNANSSLTTALLGHYNKKEPDPEGIDVVTQYFLSHGCRVIVVVPSFWLRAKPASQDGNQQNALMVTPQLETLQHLQTRGLLCCAPPSDDDDAYAIAIARRAERQSAAAAMPQTTNLFYGRAYLLSNDWFRDAIQRDRGATGLKEWLQYGSSNVPTGPGRISYTFCHMGAASRSEGEPLKLDFIPNPRHALIDHIERAAVSEGYSL